MISIVTSVLTSHLLFGHSFFDKQLSDRGIDIAGGRSGLEMMERNIVTIQDLLLAQPNALVSSHFQIEIISIKSDASLQQAMEVAVKFVGESIPIIDREKNKMLGIVTEADLFKDYLALQDKIVDLERR
jgi:CIC family chloride channel protein